MYYYGAKSLDRCGCQGQHTCIRGVKDTPWNQSAATSDDNKLLLHGYVTIKINTYRMLTHDHGNHAIDT